MLVKDLQADYKVDDKKQFGFSIIPSVIIPNKSLSDGDFRVLSALMSYLDVFGETFISNSELAKKSGKSLSAVKRSLKSLIDNGYLTSRVERQGMMVTKRYLSKTALLDSIKKESISPQTDGVSPQKRGGKPNNALLGKPNSGLENSNIKDNSITNNIESVSSGKDYKQTWNIFANKHGLSPIIKLTDSRKSHIKQRISENEFVFDTILSEIEKSKFLLGVNDKGWKVDFDFIVGSKNNYIKILEGKYRQNNNMRVPI